MIQYNPKDWFTFIFKLHKSDTFRELFPLMIGNGIYALVVVLLMKNVLHLSADNELKNITVIHSILGFVISLLLVFRTNTAYDRWWEGRKLWGSLVNTSRDFSMKIKMVVDNRDVEFFNNAIIEFAHCLKEHLKKSKSATHEPSEIVLKMYERLNNVKTYKDSNNFIIAEQLACIYNQLQAFSDICGGCERIRNTPIPYSYNVFIKKFIFFYVMTLPWGYTFTLGYWIIPVVMFVFYVLASMELIAEEIEDPFGNDGNDLPIHSICKTIESSVNQILTIKK